MIVNLRSKTTSRVGLAWAYHCHMMYNYCCCCCCCCWWWWL